VAGAGIILDGEAERDGLDISARLGRAQIDAVDGAEPLLSNAAIAQARFP